jgi:hypothetical protein
MADSDKPGGESWEDRVEARHAADHQTSVIAAFEVNPVRWALEHAGIDTTDRQAMAAWSERQRDAREAAERSEVWAERRGRGAWLLLSACIGSLMASLPWIGSFLRGLFSGHGGAGR